MGREPKHIELAGICTNSLEAQARKRRESWRFCRPFAATGKKIRKPAFWPETTQHTLRWSLCALVSVGLLLEAPLSAFAVYSCGGVQDTCQCGRDNFCICCEWSGSSGNCVWYAWHKACCEWGRGLEWCTDAHTFDDYARNNGYPVRAEACENTIFVCEAYASPCTNGQYGHVGWVTRVYPDGSTDVEEQGCYSWNGVRTRNIPMQNISPTVEYIYAPGTSCQQCECEVGATERRDCGRCGTQTRTCNGECRWGDWAACQDEGPCQPDESRECGQCGSQICDGACQWGECVGGGVCTPNDTNGCGNCGTQLCDDSCQWGACQDEGECEPGDERSCGTCGQQLCDEACQWGSCIEDTCADPAPDQSTDVITEFVESDVVPAVDVPPADVTSDGTGTTNSLEGSCGCRTGMTRHTVNPLYALILLCVIGRWPWRRRKGLFPWR